MAMFSKKDLESQQSGGAQGDETIVGPSVKLEGDLKSNGSIRIEGEVVGKVETTGELYVGESARIDADVKAGNAKVLGSVNGNLTAKEDLELGEQAKVSGDVNTGMLSVARGAKLNGQCNMGGEEGQEAKDKS